MAFQPARRAAYRHPAAGEIEAVGTRQVHATYPLACHVDVLIVDDADAVCGVVGTRGVVVVDATGNGDHLRLQLRRRRECREFLADSIAKRYADVLDGLDNPVALDHIEVAEPDLKSADGSWVKQPRTGTPHSTVRITKL